ncbi:hypothetical protein DGG96_07355 [Legionella qingyii]|uniref:Uncharacterized protein n=1 Tax=Legionella qingyii TaxID=2184757 RepID=A0A317U2M5_9GAMM|nr:hypothetical protein DGG96_07355 [Legionella qingyii]
MDQKVKVYFNVLDDGIDYPMVFLMDELCDQGVPDFSCIKDGMVDFVGVRKGEVTEMVLIIIVPTMVYGGPEVNWDEILVSNEVVYSYFVI